MSLEAAAAAIQYTWLEQHCMEDRAAPQGYLLGKLRASCCLGISPDSAALAPSHIRRPRALTQAADKGGVYQGCQGVSRQGGQHLQQGVNGSRVGRQCEHGLAICCVHYTDNELLLSPNPFSKIFVPVYHERQEPPAADMVLSLRLMPAAARYQGVKPPTGSAKERMSFMTAVIEGGVTSLPPLLLLLLTS
jgi:hypothetical protein